MKTTKKQDTRNEYPAVGSGSYLSSRAVSGQVLSAYESLTSVFGMGTGGSSQLNHRKGVGVKHPENRITLVIHFD